MTGLRGFFAVSSILWAAAALVLIAGAFKRLRDRRLDRIAREHRDAIGERVAAELKGTPLPPVSAEDADAFLAAVLEPGSDGRRAA